MIGKPVSNASFRSSLDYLAGKPEARMIATNMEGRNPRELAREFGVVRRLRPTLGKAVFHAPLRLAVGEHLSEPQWRRVAERVIAGMGLTDCPWVVYLHPDEPGGTGGAEEAGKAARVAPGGRGSAGGRGEAGARGDADARPGRGELGKGVHAHLVASRVNFLGQVISDSRSLERLALIERRIERDYRLREVPLVRNRVRRPGRGDAKFEERTGRGSERRGLQRIVAAAARPGRPVGEVVAELRRRGVEVRVRVTATGAVTGITYRRGRYEFSGSGLGTDFTWPGLLARRGLSFVPERDLPALFAAATAARAATAATRPTAVARRGRDGGRTLEETMSEARSGRAEGASFAEEALAELDDRRTMEVAEVRVGWDEADAGGGETAGAGDALEDGDPAGEGDSGASADESAVAPAGAAGTGQAVEEEIEEERDVAVAGAPEDDLEEPAAPGPGESEGGQVGAGASGAAQGAVGWGGRGGDRTADQVARQLAAIGCPRYDILVLDAASGAHVARRQAWTPEQVAAALRWLKHQNAQGGEILVRPAAAAGLTLLAGVPAEHLKSAAQAGFQPAAVLRAPDGGREVWLRGGATLPPMVQQAVDRELERIFRASRPVHTPGYGHLTGFTSPLAQRAGAEKFALKRAPFLTLEEARGRVFREWRPLVRRVRERLSAVAVERRIEREMALLGGWAGGGRSGMAVGVAGTVRRPAWPARETLWRRRRLKQRVPRRRRGPGRRTARRRWDRCRRTLRRGSQRSRGAPRPAKPVPARSKKSVRPPRPAMASPARSWKTVGPPLRPAEAPTPPRRLPGAAAVSAATCGQASTAGSSPISWRWPTSRRWRWVPWGRCRTRLPRRRRLAGARRRRRRGGATRRPWRRLRARWPRGAGTRRRRRRSRWSRGCGRSIAAGASWPISWGSGRCRTASRPAWCGSWRGGARRSPRRSTGASG